MIKNKRLYNTSIFVAIISTIVFHSNMIVHGEILQEHEILQIQDEKAQLEDSPSEFYSHGSDEGRKIVAVGANIYWCSKANQAHSSSRVTYTNVGWNVQLRSETNREIVYYIPSNSCILKSETINGNIYNLYCIPREKIIQLVQESPYTKEFMQGDIIVEMDGNIGIKKNGKIFTKAFDLRDPNEMEQLFIEMKKQSFSQQSYKNIKQYYCNKTTSFASIELQPVTMWNHRYHWLEGLICKEGNNETGDKYLLDKVSIQQELGQECVIQEGQGLSGIQGFQVRTKVWTDDIDRRWQGYELPYSFKQGQQELEFHYFYTPISYPITYHLNGGVNDRKNKQWYNVLYGATLYKPTMEGAKFLGWYYEDKEIKAINEKPITDLSYTNLCQQLPERMQGEVIVEAKWDLQPQIYTQDIYGYLSKENWLERVMDEVIAVDYEDGELTDSIVWVNREDVMEKVGAYEKEKTNRNKEYKIPIIYQVKDKSGQEVKAEAILYLYGIGEQKVTTRSYRYIAEEYYDTLDKDSIWKQSNNWNQLKEMMKK